MDKSPHQLARTMSTSSEEFRKFVNRLLYEDTSKFNFQDSTNKQIVERALTVKTLNKTKFSEKHFFKTSEDIISTQ